MKDHNRREISGLNPSILEQYESERLSREHDAPLTFTATERYASLSGCRGVFVGVVTMIALVGLLWLSAGIWFGLRSVDDRTAGSSSWRATK